MNARQSWLFSLFLVVVVAGLVYLISATISHRRMLKKYDSSYAKIQIGDSKQVVTSLMGELPRSRAADMCHSMTKPPKSNSKQSVESNLCMEFYLRTTTYTSIATAKYWIRTAQFLRKTLEKLCQTWGEVHAEMGVRRFAILANLSIDED